MNFIQRIRKWTMRLPSSWGLGQADIHSSLIITLALLSCLILLASSARSGLHEVQTLAITLPIVWIVSLAVRIAAQQLSIGSYSMDLSTSVGPTGNLSTDYEYLPPKQMLAYAISGSMASVGLVLLGMIVNAAMIPGQDGDLSWAQLLDVHSGWESRAWATQIVWVNLFICVLNLLPTVPFDARAVVFAIFAHRFSSVQEPSVFRRIASFDSHLSALVMGAGLSAAAFGMLLGREVIGWYAAVAAAVYLFVASCWETSRADEIEEQYSPLARRAAHQSSSPHRVPHLKFDQKPDERDYLGSRSDSEANADRVVEYVAEASQSAEDILNSDSAGDKQVEFQADVDEILRKLHREGSAALSIPEHQALLAASRRLKQKRSRLP